MTADPNDPSLRSFVEADPESHFPIQNLPFGIFSVNGSPKPRAGVAIGSQVLDLETLDRVGLLSTGCEGVFSRSSLNGFLELGPDAWKAARSRISVLLRQETPDIRDDPALRAEALRNMADVTMHMPVDVSGFSDFMLSKEHSKNCVEIVGGASHGELWPNWHHLPMGYNGRASSVVVSGSPVTRPWGQIKKPASPAPVYAVSQQMDFELEVAAVIGLPSQVGLPVRLPQAEDHVFGLVLLNDWSARDIQAWEAQPLGVFNSKNLSTSISPWIVTLAALEPFRATGPSQEPTPLPYLRQEGSRSFDIALEASLQPAASAQRSVISRVNFKRMYWSIAQQVVHQTSAGCNLRSGDLLASGTVSGTGEGQLGCLFEVTRAGRASFQLVDGTSRTYLEDGDEVAFTGWCQGDGYRVGFGTCSGRLVPALESA